MEYSVNIEQNNTDKFTIIVWSVILGVVFLVTLSAIFNTQNIEKQIKICVDNGYPDHTQIGGTVYCIKKLNITKLHVRVNELEKK